MPHQELYNKIIAENTDNQLPAQYFKALTEKYPFFSAPHFLLLKETPESDTNYKKIAARTSLHFNNPYLLKFRLTEKKEIINTEEIVSNILPEQIIQLKEEVVVIEPVQQEIVSSSAEVFLPDLVIKSEEIETAGKKEELIFEPLHTTDYFASQGIKLSEEVQTADKLGKQLKSFTDWLKTMKKVQAGKLPEGSTQIDVAVQNLAEKSNKGQEILTESMAEVYAKQGKPGKANEIYKKLSLLNPAKSAYFAAKIELLKEN